MLGWCGISFQGDHRGPSVFDRQKTSQSSLEHRWVINTAPSLEEMQHSYFHTTLFVGAVGGGLLLVGNTWDAALSSHKIKGCKTCWWLKGGRRFLASSLLLHTCITAGHDLFNFMYIWKPISPYHSSCTPYSSDTGHLENLILHKGWDGSVQFQFK